MEQTWCIVKIETNNGLRLGLDYNFDCNKKDIIRNNLTYDQAVELIDQISAELGIKTFNNHTDYQIF